MQKYGESYSFWLIPSENTTSEEYSDIMGGISHVCEETERLARTHKLPYEIFAFPFKISSTEKIYLSVCLFKGVSLFGVFDAKSNRLHHNYSSKEFSGFTLRRFEDFAYRNKNMLERKVQGIRSKQINGLLEAWVQYIYKNQSLVNEVVQADKNKKIFLENPEECRPTLTR